MAFPKNDRVYENRNTEARKAEKSGLTVPERVPLNGTISLASAGVGAEINTAPRQARNSGMMRFFSPCLF